MQASDGSAPPRLTPRQLEVLELMAKGLQNREIGEVLGIAPNTVKRHVAAILESLEVANRTEAATALLELGLGAGTQASPTSAAVPGFGNRPAIAVLPFDDLSKEPEHPYLAAGIVEDLTTRLACWRWLPVIARNSACVYGEGPVDVREASRALGARYLVEGSLRAAGPRARLTVQLVDGESGEHVWARSYDFALDDVFTITDEIVDSIVATLEPALMKIPGIRTPAQGPAHFGPWECLGRGYAALSNGTWKGVEASAPLFERALALDPSMARASAALAWHESLRLIHQRSDDVAASQARAIGYAKRAIEIDPNEAGGHLALGFARVLAREPRAGLASAERAVELNPSSAWAHFAYAFALVPTSRARVEEAIAALRKAIRLSPQDPFLFWIWMSLGNAYLQVPRFDTAMECLEAARALVPDEPFIYPSIAACHIVQGNPSEARANIERMKELRPDYSPLWLYRRCATAEVYRVGAQVLAAAGWMEADERLSE